MVKAIWPMQTHVYNKSGKSRRKKKKKNKQNCRKQLKKSVVGKTKQKKNK